jgi:Carboxypeptidase regulatory-like domain/Fibronectin type III domain
MMQRACAFLFLFMTAACGGGDGTTTAPTPTPAQTSTANTFSLSGLVTNSADGTIISGATVSIADGPNAGKATTTDGSGNYGFTGLQQAGFTVSVSASEYGSQSRGVTLTSNQTLSFQLTLTTFTLNGTVTDGTSGAVLPNSVVQVSEGLNAGKSATADSTGTYTIGGLVPGAFTLSASAVGYQTTARQIAVSADTGIDFVLQRSCNPPGTPGFLGWSSAGSPSGSVQLSWVPATGTVTSYVIEVGTTIGGTDVAVIDTDNTATSYTLTGLRTSVDFYHVRVRAKNSCGVSGPSNEANPRIA